MTPQSESSYSYDNYVQMATPRDETLNKSVSSGSITSTKELATLSGTAGNLTFQNSTGGIQTRSATSLSEVTIPPTDGYTKSPLTVEANKLYLTKTEDGGKSYYGKIFVKGVNGTTATVDYCLQTAADVLSY